MLLIHRQREGQGVEEVLIQRMRQIVVGGAVLGEVERVFVASEGELAPHGQLALLQRGPSCSGDNDTVLEHTRGLGDGSLAGAGDGYR